METHSEGQRRAFKFNPMMMLKFSFVLPFMMLNWPECFLRRALTRVAEGASSKVLCTLSSGC